MREESLEIKQIPAPDKQQAVVISTIRDEQGIRQGIGVVYNPASNGSYDPQALIDKATRLAVDRAKNNNQNILSKSEPSQTVPQGMKPSYDKQSNGHKHNTKPGSVTDNQLYALNKIAQERHQNLADVTNGKFGVKPEGMSSEQANSLFSFFK